MDLKAQILAAQKRMEPVEVPEWGFPVFVRRMTLSERGIFADALDAAIESHDAEKMRATSRLILSLTLCDENGKKIFENPTELTGIDAVIADELALKALDINRLRKEAIADAEKKFKSAGNSGLSSGSPTISTKAENGSAKT